MVTNRPGVDVLPQAVYDEYAMRGESENRNKELKIELHAGRLSDHRFVANFFRLYLHAAALNLLIRLRHAVAGAAPTSAEGDLPMPAERSTNRPAGSSSTAAACATRWAKVSPAPGGRD